MKVARNISGAALAVALLSSPVAALAGSKTRVDFEIGVGKYGNGILAVIAP